MKSLSIFALIALTGCAVPPPESRIESGKVKGTPSRWSASPEARAGIDTNWVGRIGGSRVSSMVREALGSNFEIQIAAERVKRADAAAETAGAAIKPQVSAGLDGARSKQIFVGFPFGDGGVPSSISESFGANLMVSWEPDVWGFRRAGQAALIADAQAERNLYRAGQASLAAQILRSWLALAESNEQIALAQKSNDLLKTTLEIVRERFENALAEQGGSVAQVRLAESEVATNEALLAQYQGAREQAIRQLEILMGRYPRGAIQSSDKLPVIPPMPPAGLPSELLLRRPDILAAERGVAATGSLLKQGRLAFYPRFALTTRSGTTTDSLRQILNSDFGVWSLAGSLTQPIWAGGALRSEAKRLKADERSAIAQLQKTVLNAFGEVENAMVADRFLAAREAAINKALKSATDATRSARDEYSGGTGDALTLMTAQSNQIKLSSQVVALRRLRLDNRVTLHLALGGDYDFSK